MIGDSSPCQYLAIWQEGLQLAQASFADSAVFKFLTTVKPIILVY